MSQPTIADVDRITALPDPILRNLLITYTYSELSRTLCERLGEAANWCTFATWASRQAGNTIRGEDLADALQQRLRGAPEVRRVIEDIVEVTVAAHPLDAPQLEDAVHERLIGGEAAARAADAVARGNQKVFEEIAREFARFCEELPDATSCTADNIARFVGVLRAGEPPEGQERLRRAFAAYAEAACTNDATARSQLLLYANLLVGFHEQTRLQPEIRAALDAARTELEALRKRLIKLLLPSWWLRIRRIIAHLLRRPMPLDMLLDKLIDHVCGELRELITAQLMTLQLPSGAIQLGRELNVRFPTSLDQLQYAPLTELIAAIELPHLPAADERDWSDFPYRMHFIARLFRGYQENAQLLTAPYSTAQVEALLAGRVPPPPL